jgi:hypothetical protein
MTSLRTLSAIAFAVGFGACGALGGAETPPDGAEVAKETKGSIRISIEVVPSHAGMERVKATVTNGGEVDQLVNLGVMLGNGNAMFPSAIVLECESEDGKKFNMVREPSGVAGRVDPLIIPLPAGASWTVVLPLRQMNVQGPKGPERIAPGTYSVRAVFTGKPVAKGQTNSDTEGLATWRFWKGTVRSGEATVEIR